MSLDSFAYERIPTKRMGKNFLKTDCFPQLRHLHFGWTSHTNLVRITKSCPRLEYLKCWTDITEWNLLPKGFKKIERRSWIP